MLEPSILRLLDCTVLFDKYPSLCLLLLILLPNSFPEVACQWLRLVEVYLLLVWDR